MERRATVNFVFPSQHSADTTQVVMLCDWNIARKPLYLARNNYAQLNVARNFLLLRDFSAILRDSAFAQLREVTQCPSK